MNVSLVLMSVMTMRPASIMLGTTPVVIATGDFWVMDIISVNVSHSHDGFGTSKSSWLTEGDASIQFDSPTI